MSNLNLHPENYYSLIDRIDFSPIRGKRLFITGGTGFFGLWLNNLFQALNQKGYDITVTLLSRDPEAFLKKNPSYLHSSWLNWVHGDVLSYQIPLQKFDLFIHGAADTSPGALDKPTQLFTSIVSGTERVLKHAVDSGAGRMLFVSSGAVYGEAPSGIDLISEDTNSAPQTNETANVYGEAKRAAEMLAYCYQKEYGLEIVVARCFAFMGAGIGQHLVINQFIQQALHSPQIVIKGSGTSRRSFLHGQDLALWLLKLLVAGNAGEIYNVGSDHGFTIKQLAELVRDEISPEKAVTVLGTQKKEFRMNYVPSITKTKSLGLDVWTSLKETIRQQKSY